MPQPTFHIPQLAQQHFGLNATVTDLPGEIDLNFKVKADNGHLYTLKIAHAREDRAALELQNAVMTHLAAAGLDVPQVVPSLLGAGITEIQAPDGSTRYLRLLTWIEGRCFAEVNPHTPELIEQVGRLCGSICGALADFDHPAAHRFLKWDPSQAAWTAQQFHLIPEGERLQTAAYFYGLFEQKAQPLLPKLRKSVNYNDANDYNLLVSHNPVSPTVPGVIDFGDVTYTHTINDLAIAAAYVLMHKPDPLTALYHLTKGFHAAFPITPEEAEVLLPMIGARLLISVTCSAMNLAEHPENVYLQISDAPAWDLLFKLRQIHPSLVLATVRHACGWEPCPQHVAFVQWAQQHYPTLHPIVPTDLDKAVWLDLGVGSADLGTYADIEDAQRLHQRIVESMTAPDGSLLTGIGRYNETRPFYTADAYEVQGNEGPQWRTVHIGLDIFMPPGTPIFAPLEGKIHSFKDNANDRDYGPAIILEHRVTDGLVFYTLYGHLSRTDLDGLEVGQTIAAGQAFCTMGPMPENGNWSPHLHFQVILDLMDGQGDYPGVAFPHQRTVWTSLCPDPWLLLTGQHSVPKASMGMEDIRQYRQQHLGKNLSVSYSQPLHMLRGWRQYLFDHTGRRFLDTVNNVAHVGHEHPRVVRAGQRQMGVLNTNTRYLHANIVQFAEALLATCPAPLEVAFFVNSGSEANELALRLAKNYTQSQEMLVVDVGYHGNTQGCVAVSAYKFDGPGGKGTPPHTHVTPMPDAYRGPFKGDTEETGRLYAAEVQKKIVELGQNGLKPAAFLCESVISCGGQVPLPKSYLTHAVAAVRGAGGLYIADEVQTGCGRHGAHFWAFEEHGVVPDILTIGKPIGNGHPLGVVVTTRAIADAFANGMEYFNTFGGNPVSCAIGLEVLRVIQAEGLQENARLTGAYLQQGLHDLAQRFPIIGDVRGPGLFLGFELVQSRETLEPAPEQTAYLANRMRELGILMSTDGPFHNVIKIKPPIVFNQKDADFLLHTLERVFKEDRMKG